MSKNLTRRKNCVFIGGVPSGLTDRMLRGYFQRFGEIRSITLNKVKHETSEPMSKDATIHYKNSNCAAEPFVHKGSGFIEFSSSQAVRGATQTKEHYINGFKIDCRVAMTNNERKNYQRSIMHERRKVFIGKLPPGISKEMLQSYFVQFSEIEEVTLIYKPEKSFGISFILFKKPYVGDQLINKAFEIAPGVFVECELALNPQQLHQRKLECSGQAHPENILQNEIGEYDDGNFPQVKTFPDSYQEGQENCPRDLHGLEEYEDKLSSPGRDQINGLPVQVESKKPDRSQEQETAYSYSKRCSKQGSWSDAYFGSDRKISLPNLPAHQGNFCPVSQLNPLTEEHFQPQRKVSEHFGQERADAGDNEVIADVSALFLPTEGSGQASRTFIMPEHQPVLKKRWSSIKRRHSAAGHHSLYTLFH